MNRIETGFLLYTARYCSICRSLHPLENDLLAEV